MRIAFVKDAVYPWKMGGAQKRTWEVARRLADDHDVHWYGMHYWDGPPTIEREGITFHGVCEPRELYVDGRRSISQALYFTRKLVRPMVRADFDLIECQKSSLFPFFASKAGTARSDAVLLGFWTEVWGDYWYQYLGRKGVFGKGVERLAVRTPDTIIAISEYIERELHGIGRTDGIEVVHNGVDYHGIEKVSPASAPWDVIYFGRLVPHKNVDMLLEAISLASDELETEIRCAIIGDGPERETLESYTSEIGVASQVEFLGFVEDEADVMANLKRSKVFVHPSQQEGFSNTILEANACGVPSIVTDEENSGNTAIVEDGETGFIVEPTVDALAARIVDVLEDATLRDELSDGALAFGEAHDWGRIVEQTEDVYRRAVEC